MSDGLHRVFTGQTLTPAQLRVAGAVALAWFLMDLVQWLDWAWARLHGCVS